MFLKVLSLASLLFISVKSDGGYFRDYYWRTYIDAIPNDAIAGGENENGTTYIGQVYWSDLTAVEIIPGFKEVYVPEGQPPTLVNSSFISILCSNHPEKLRWYSTNTQEFPQLLKEKTVVRGGVNIARNPYYIARVFFRDQHIVGRVQHTVVYSRYYIEAAYWNAGEYSYHQSDVFDVLVYEDPVL